MKTAITATHVGHLTVAEYEKRMRQAMDEMQRQIDREMSYTPKFRKVDDIAAWLKHLARLDLELTDAMDESNYLSRRAKAN